MFQDYLKKIEARKDLEVHETEIAFEDILAGQISEADLISFLVALRDKGESVAEVKGAVFALKRKALRLSCRTKEVLDTCGTGGDQKNTFNISTAAAFVVAGAGIPVAKHGNRAVSSRSGSADILKACGVNLEVSPEIVARCVDEIGIGFLFAPLYHPAMKMVASARQKIGTKTIFNILGPLLNPAGAKRQMIGVYDRRLLPIVVEVLKDLGSESAGVVHGEDGLDEITLTTTTRISWLEKGKIHEEIFDPRVVGYPYCRPEDLQGGTAEENAKRLRRMLKGHSLPLDHCVHINAAVAICVGGGAKDIHEGLLAAQESISSGRAYQKLEALVEMTNQR